MFKMLINENLQFSNITNIFRKKLNQKILLLITVFVLLSVGFVIGAECGTTPTNNCTISVTTTFDSGIYVLNDTAEQDGAIIINGSSLTLDCSESRIVSNSSTTSWGMYVLGTDVTIQNCNITNYTRAIFSNTNAHGLIIQDNYLYNNSVAGYLSFSLYNLTFQRNILEDASVQANGAFNSIFQYNNATGDMANDGKSGNKAYTMAVFSTSTGGVNNITINDNILKGEMGILVEDKAFNITIKNNTFENNDIGLQIHGLDNQVKGVDVLGNDFINQTWNFDHFDVGLRIRNASDIWIENNNFSEISSTAITIQKHSNNITIKNNYFYTIPISERSNYKADDWSDPPCAIQIVELYKSWLGGGDEVGFDDGIELIGNYSSTNVSISGNTFDSNTQCYLRNQGGTDIDYDWTSFWYRSFRVPRYLVDKDEFWINNDFNNLSLYNNTNIFENFYQGYRQNRKINVTIFNTYMKFANANTTTNYNTTIFSSNISSHVIYNFTNKSFYPENTLQDNSEVNITLEPNMEIYVIDEATLTEGNNKGLTDSAGNEIEPQVNFSSNSSTEKKIVSSITTSFNLTSKFKVDTCLNKQIAELSYPPETKYLKSISYNSHLGETSYTDGSCTNNQKTITSQIDNSSNSNIITIEYAYTPSYDPAVIFGGGTGGGGMPSEDPDVEIDEEPLAEIKEEVEGKVETAKEKFEELGQKYGLFDEVGFGINMLEFLILIAFISTLLTFILPKKHRIYGFITGFILIVFSKVFQKKIFSSESMNSFFSRIEPLGKIVGEPQLFWAILIISLAGFIAFRLIKEAVTESES